MRRRLGLILAVGLLALALSAVGVASASQDAAKATTTVTVGMYELKFALSKKVVPRGKVVFRVTNKGQIPHDFKIAGKKIPVIGGGKSATVTVNFARKGRYYFLCTVPGHVTGGMFGYLTVK